MKGAFTMQSIVLKKTIISLLKLFHVICCDTIVCVMVLFGQKHVHLDFNARWSIDATYSEGDQCFFSFLLVISAEIVVIKMLSFPFHRRFMDFNTWFCPKLWMKTKNLEQIFQSSLKSFTYLLLFPHLSSSIY